MAWLGQTPSHNLNQCQPSSWTPNGIISNPRFHCVNSLWPSVAIWWHRSGSTLVQVMAWCHQAPSHYLTRCWLFIIEVLRHSVENIFITSAQLLFCIKHVKVILLKLLLYLLPWDSELKYTILKAPLLHTHCEVKPQNTKLCITVLRSHLSVHKASPMSRPLMEFNRNASGVEAGENMVNTTVANALAPGVTRASSAMILTIINEQILVFHEKGFQQPISCHHWNMTNNANTFSDFHKPIQHVKG